MPTNKILNSGISIVIPAYNEENAIQKTVETTYKTLFEIESLPFEIIVVDDSSTDNTNINIPKTICRVFKHPKNYGYGRTLLTGINQAKFPYIGIIDADSTYDPEHFKEMIPQMDIFDMVIGERRISDQSKVVSLMRKTLKTLILFFSEHDSRDPNSGLRIFKKSLVDKGGHLFSKRFSFSTSLTFFAALNHQFIEYHPIEYHDRTGHSKVRHFRDSLRTFWLVMSMALIYRPMKCFSALIAANVAGLSFLLSWRKKVSAQTLLSSVAGWVSSILLLGISFFAFILGKHYELTISDDD